VAVTRRVLDSTARPAGGAASKPRVGAEALARPPTTSFTLAALRILMDALVIGTAVAIAFPLRFRWHVLEATPGPLDPPAHLAAGALWLVAVVGAMASQGLYDEDTLGAGGREMTRIRRALLEGVGVVSAAVFLLRFVTVSRGWFMLVVALSLALLAAERMTARALLGWLWARGQFRRPAILVTTSEFPGQNPEFGEFDVVATVAPDQVPSLLGPGAMVLGRGPAPVVIVDDGADLPRDDLWRLVIQAGDAGFPVFLRSPFRPLPSDRLTTRQLGERTIVKVSPPALTGLRAFQKRLLDVATALFLLPVVALPMAAIALAVLVTSGRPVLFRQQRVGKDGHLFAMWKFRTMRVDAEKETGPVWAGARDARRTPLGRFLRRTSLDELPQLWNVLRGHMSIVGPRPERPMFVARFSDGNPWYRFRHRIRPGITGLAQIRGLRGDTPLEPRVESDNWYIEHWSLWLDLRIAAHTFLEVVRGRNAH
jgi:lipopolysaccharide/colanic/teichoic acid biosynthesis glycosyltransferase